MIEFEFIHEGGVSKSYFNRLPELLNNQIIHADIRSLSPDDLVYFVELYAIFQYEFALVNYLNNEFIEKADIDAIDKKDGWAIAINDWTEGNKDLLLTNIKEDALGFFSIPDANDVDFRIGQTWLEVVDLIEKNNS